MTLPAHASSPQSSSLVFSRLLSPSLVLSHPLSSSLILTTASTSLCLSLELLLHFYFYSYELTAAQQYLNKVAVERAVREEKKNADMQLAQARGAMVAAMQAWFKLGGSGMRHVHVCMDAEPPPVSVYESNLRLYEELEAQQQIILAAAAQIAKEQKLSKEAEKALSGQMLTRVQMRLHALRAKLNANRQPAEQVAPLAGGLQAALTRDSRPSSPSVTPSSLATTVECAPRQRSELMRPSSPVPFDLGVDLGPSHFNLGMDLSPPQPLPYGAGSDDRERAVSFYGSEDAFLPSNEFKGEVAGFAFTNGEWGLGYYRDDVRFAASPPPHHMSSPQRHEPRPSPPRTLRRALSRSTMGASMSNLFGASIENLRSHLPRSLRGAGGGHGGEGVGRSEASRRRAEAAQWGGARMEADVQRREAGQASSGFFGRGAGHFGSPDAREAARHNAPLNDHYTQRRARGGVALEC